MEGKQHTNRFGNPQYDRYSVANTKDKIVNENAPRERLYNLKYKFDQQLANNYPVIQKYQMKSQPQIENASTIISSLILRPVW